MTTATVTETVPVPALVWAGLDRAEVEYRRACRMRADTHAARARQMGRIAAVFEREARWWGVLARWTYSPSGEMSFLYGRATIVAKHDARNRAEKYRDLEASAWRCCLELASDSGVAA